MLLTLSKESLHQVFSYLNVNDLQQIAQTSHFLRNTLLSIKYDYPALFPLNKTVYPEIQLKLTRVLVLNESLFNQIWFKKVLDHFKNVDTIEIAITMTRATISLVCRLFANKDAPRTIFVLSNEIKRWIAQNNKSKTNNIIKPLPVSFREKRAELLAIKQDGLYKNPLLKNVFSTPINDVSEKWQAAANALTKLKEDSITKLKRQPKLDTLLEGLSLNNIMIMACENYKAYGLKRHYWEVIVDESKNQFIKDLLLSNEEEEKNLDKVVNDFSKHCSTYLSRIEERVETYKELELYNTEQGKKVIDMLENISKNITHYNWNNQKIGEDTYIKKIVDPILSAYLNELIPNIVFFGSDHELSESRSRKLCQAIQENEPVNNIRGRYADLSGEVALSEESKHHVFLCEIKTEKKASNREDMVKLGFMMKDCIDMAILDGLKPLVCTVVGLLIEGENCSLYTMDIPEKKLYRMTEVETFSLPTTHKNMYSLVHAYKCLLLCSSLVQRYANVFFDKASYVQSNDSYTHIVPSCSSPKRHVNYYT